MSTSPPRSIAMLALFSTTVIWGLAFPLTRDGMIATSEALERALPGTGAGRLGPTFFLAVRFAAASVLACLLPGALRGLSSAAGIRDALLVSVPNLVGFMLQNYGLMETSATLGAFLTSAYVVLVPAIVVGVRRERPPGRLLAGLVAVSAGIAVLTLGRGPGADGAPARFGRGEALSLACAVAFAVQVYLLDGASKRTRPEALALGTMVFTAAGALAVLVALPAGRATLSSAGFAAVLAEPRATLGLGYAAVAASALAFFLMYRYQRAMSPTRAALIYAAEPAFAAAFAHVLGGEPFGPVLLLGCSLVLIGNVLAELRRPSP